MARSGDMRDYSELVNLVRGCSSLRTTEPWHFQQAFEGEQVCLRSFDRVIDWSDQDLVLRVQAGKKLGHIGRDFKKIGIPHPYLTLMYHGPEFEDMTLADLVMWNMPHWCMARCGSWRDWLLGGKFLLSDGTIVESGANVVKSVSGFDFHKLIIGSRGTLAIPLELSIRLFRLDNSPKTPDELISGDRKVFDRECDLLIVKTDANGLAQLTPQCVGKIGMTSPPNGLIWLLGTEPDQIEMPAHAQWWFASQDRGAVSDPCPQTQVLMRRTKQLFDPSNKLNPGEFGFL